MGERLSGLPPDHLVNAGQIASAVASGEMRATDVAAHALAEAERLQPRINAFTHLDHTGAFQQAERIDEARIAGHLLGPLAGVPVALKDLIDQKGQVTTCGSAFYRKVADHSSTVVQRLEAAGAVIIGRTGLHEFAFGFSSENPWFGPVRNPWNPDLSPGGSSGGSAAAVAAGITPLAIGTDTGGSIRVPAAVCGTWGLKVTHGRVPLTGVFPLAGSLDTVGPLGTTAGDLASAFRIMAGYDPADPWSVPDSEARPRPISHMSAPRIGVPQPWVDHGPTTAEVRESFVWALDRLSELGAEVVEVAAPALEPFGMINELAQSEIAEVHRPFWNDPAKHYGDDVGERMRAAFDITVDEATAARRWRAETQHAAARLFDRVDFLITPAVASMHKEIGVNDVDVDGRPMFYRPVFSWFSALVNHLSLPALTAPLALGGEPSPSIQLVGPAWSEERLLEVGGRMEAAGIAGFRAASG